MVISCDDCRRSRADVFFNLKLLQTPCKGEIRTSHKIVCKWRLFAKWNDLTKTTAERKQQEIFWRILFYPSVGATVAQSFCSLPCLRAICPWNIMKSPPLQVLDVTSLVQHHWVKTSPLFGLETVPAVLRCDSGLIGQESSSQYLGQRRNKHCNLMRLLLKHMDVMKRFAFFEDGFSDFESTYMWHMSYHSHSQLLSKFDPECWSAQDTNQSCHWFWRVWRSAQLRANDWVPLVDRCLDWLGLDDHWLVVWNMVNIG